MKLTSGFVFLNDVRFYAHHGVTAQERTVGGSFIVSLRISFPLAGAVGSDEVADTVNYATVFQLVREEMDQPSRLLEHLAGRIAKRVLSSFPQVTSVDISVTKENPPMGADCAGAGVELHFMNEKTL